MVLGMGDRYEPLRLKAAKALYESTDAGREYAWSRLAEIMMKCGLSNSYSMLLIWDFYLLGLLERPRPGLYRVNKARLKAYIEEYEAKLARLKARGGGSGGPAPSQG
jgi:hypothetical protein